MEVRGFFDQIVWRDDNCLNRHRRIWAEAHTECVRTQPGCTRFRDRGASAPRERLICQKSEQNRWTSGQKGSNRCL